MFVVAEVPKANGLPKIALATTQEHTNVPQRTTFEFELSAVVGPKDVFGKRFSGGATGSLSPSAERAGAYAFAFGTDRGTGGGGGPFAKTSL